MAKSSWNQKAWITELMVPFYSLPAHKPVIDTSIEILYLRKTRVSSTKDSSVTLEQKKMLKRQNKVRR